MPKSRITSSSYDLTKAFWTFSKVSQTPAPDSTSGLFDASLSLQGWWRLNADVSSAGDSLDSTHHHRDGTFDGSTERPTYSESLYPSTYIQNSSNTFDGVNDAVNIGTAATWDAIIGNDTGGGSTQKMSISVWVYKTGDETANGRVWNFGNLNAAVGGLTLWTTGTEEVKFYTLWNGAGARWATSSSAISLDTWAHIVLTYDASSKDNVPVIYIDGVAQSLSFTATAPAGAWDGILTHDCYIGNKPSPNAGFDGNLADFAVWNSVLTANEVIDLYNASYGNIYARVYKSGYLNNPPRTTLHTRDNATGSYPTIARTTGFANTTGVYSSSFDDTNTVIFTTDFARVNLVVVNDKSPGTVDSQGRWSSSQITLTAVDSTSAVFEFNWSPEQTPSNATYVPIDLRPPALEFGIRDQVPVRDQIATALMKAVAAAAVGFSATVNKNVVTVAQTAPGSVTAPGTVISLADNVRVYDMAMSGTNAWSGGSSSPVSYPTLLQPSYVGMLTGSSRMPAGMIATPNLNSDISTTAVVRKGIADSGLQFTKGQDLLPFDESRVAAKEPLDPFQEVGMPESITPGFSSPLWSKTQIAIDTTPVETTSIFWSTGSNLGPPSAQGGTPGNSGVEYSTVDYSSVPIAVDSSLVGWWKLNEDVSSSGDVTDSSGNDRDGTFDASKNRPGDSALTPSEGIQDASNVFGTVIAAGSFVVGNLYEIRTVGTTDWEAIGASASPWAVGEQFTATGVGAGSGSALSLDEAVNIGTSAIWDAIIGNDTSGGSTQLMSFSAWVYKTGDGGSEDGRIIQFGASIGGGDAYVALYTNENDQVIVATKWDGGASAYWKTATSAFAASTWTHIVATYDATSAANEAKIYINGVSQGIFDSGTTPDGDWDGIYGGNCYIGSRNAQSVTLGRAFEGNLADVAVWNKILSNNEINVIYNAGWPDADDATLELWLEGAGSATETYKAAAAADDSATPPEFLFDATDWAVTAASIVDVIQAVSDDFWATFSGTALTIYDVDDGEDGSGFTVKFVRDDTITSSSLGGTPTPEQPYDVVSPINSGLAYFNFSDKKWEIIGDLTTGSNVDYMDKGMTGSYLATYPASNYASSYQQGDAAAATTGTGIGQPCDIAGFPNTSKFDATGSQLLDMSQYLAAPFLLEKVIIEVSGAWGMIPALNDTTLGADPGNYPQNPTVSFMLLNQYGNELDASYTLETEFQWGSSKSTVTPEEVTFPITKEKDVIAFGRVGAWCEFDEARGFDSFDDFKSFKPLQYESSDTWLSNTGRPMKDYNAPYTFYQAAPTGSIQVRFACAQTPAAPSTYPATYLNRGTPPNTRSGFILGNRIGGRNLFSLSDGRSFPGGVSGATLVQKDAIALGSPATSQNSWNAYDLSPTVSGYIIKPTDKLVLACSYQFVAATHIYASMTSMYQDEHAVASSHVQLAPGTGKITLYGSLVKDGKEYQQTTNQWLTSDALHESPGSSVLDHFDVEPLMSFSGSYVDNVISGSLLPSEAGDPGILDAATLSRDKVSMQSFGRPSMVVGSAVGGLKAGIGGYQAQGFIGAVWLGGGVGGPPGPWWLNDGAGRRVRFDAHATGPAKVADDHYYYLDEAVSALIMTTNLYDAIALAISDGNLSMVAYDPNSMPTVAAGLTPVQLAQVFPGTAGNTAIELNGSYLVYASDTPALGADASYILGNAGDGQFYGGTAATLDSSPPSLANPSLSRNVTLVDSAERFYDSMTPYPMDYYLANGDAGYPRVFDGQEYGGSDTMTHDGWSGGGHGDMRVMATKGGARGQGGGGPKGGASYPGAAYTYDTAWAGAFPFESRYRGLDRKVGFDSWDSVRGLSYYSKDENGSIGYEGVAAAARLFVSSSAGMSLFGGTPRVRQRITVPKEATNSYQLTSSYVGDATTGRKDNHPRARAAVMRWFFGSGDGPAGMPKLNLYQTTRLDAQPMDPSWGDGEWAGPGSWTMNAGDPEGLLRGWKYGLISALPYNSSAVFRRGQYGQMRDMLEQRSDSMFYGGKVRLESLSGRTRLQRQVPAVRCMFVDSITGRRTAAAETHCQNLSTFMTSSLPFFDAYRVRIGPSDTDFSVGGVWTYGRDRDDDPDLLQEATISLT